MRFETPAGANPIDRMKVVGQPVDRVDGRFKTTGTAAYAYERNDVVPNQAYGYVIGAGIAKGRIAAMDLAAARLASGVLTIVTADNAGKLGKGPRNIAKLLGGPEIDHYHQAIALVVAETFEQARAAANLVRVRYTHETGAFDLEKMKEATPGPAAGTADNTVGDFAGAFTSAPVQLDETYTTPDHSHAPMEPHATIAAWDGDKLTVWTSNQMVNWARQDLATTLGIAPDNIRVDSPFIGGGFGSKLFLRADIVLAALGARAARRPVKLALHRSLMANNTVHRPATIQRIRIGATPDGRMTAIAHESWSGNLQGGQPEDAVDQTRYFYAAANRLTGNRLGRLDLPEGNAMRAPGEASGLMALEIAMDEMAAKLGIDPVEFRILNDTQVDPGNKDRPYSKRQLVECLREGAQRFGWSARDGRPGQRREGNNLIGFGVAAGYRGAPVMPSGARAQLDNRGVVTIESDMTDIGTGSYTIMAQTAAEMMGVPVDKVVVRLGDSEFPVSAGSGGQWGASSATAGVYAACVKLREEIALKLGSNSADAVFENGQVSAGGRSLPLAQAAGDSGLSAEDKIEFGNLQRQYLQSTFAAHFIEVAVDAATGETRVRRALAVCSAGRILNPKTARSQVVGAMTMGIGAALMEELAVDKRLGFFVNHDLAGYEVPVHADIMNHEVVFLDETDPMASPMKAKGVGELGICGVGAAVANAIHNATGVRLRDYPLTLDKLIDRLPAVS